MFESGDQKGEEDDNTDSQQDEAFFAISQFLISAKEEVDCPSDYQQRNDTDYDQRYRYHSWLSINNNISDQSKCFSTYKKSCLALYHSQ